jgi:cytochrome c-type biogenesis protein CcmH/NrfG
MTTRDTGKLPLLKEAVASNPDDAKSWFNLGMALYRCSDDLSGAIEALEKAQRLSPDRDLRPFIGEAYARAKQFDIAFDLIQRSLEDDQTVRAFLALAQAHLYAGADAASALAARKALALDSNCANAYFMLGEATQRSSRQEAIHAYKMAVELNPRRSEFQQALGRELAGTDDGLADAISALRKATDLDPSDAWSHAFLANALGRIGDQRGAEDHFRIASTLASDNQELLALCAPFTGLELESHD